MKYSSYIMSFDGSQIARDSVTEVIDAIPEIVNWSAFLPQAIVIVSEKSSQEICALINQKRPREFRYVVVRAEDRGGWLPKSVWSFIKEAKAVE